MIPAIISAVGTGAQYENQRSANNQANDAEQQAILDQQDYRNKAMGTVNKLTQQIQTDSPTQIASQATGQYVQNLRKNAGATAGGQGGSTSSLAPAVGANARYNTDVASSSQAVQNFGNAEAGEMGQIDAATRQRQNEGLDMGTVGTVLQGLNTQSNAQGFVDQLRSQTASQPNPWVNLMGNLMKNGSNAYAKNANVLPSSNPLMEVQSGGVDMPY
jgi:hypothetical protein